MLLERRGVELTDDVIETIVRKTNKSSPAFIKELMRRAGRRGGALPPVVGLRQS